MIYVVEVKHIVGRKTWQAPCLADSILNHREMLWMLTWKDSCGKSEHSGMQGASTSAAGLHTAPFRRQWREIKPNVLQSGDTSSNYLNKMSSLFFFILIRVSFFFYYSVLWPTNAQLFHKLSHCYMFRHCRVIFMELHLKYLCNLTRYWL